MKKLFFIILIELVFINTAYCSYVDTTTAKTIATNFFVSRISQGKQARLRSLPVQDIELELSHQEFDDSMVINKLATNEPYYYVYNVKGNNGFIIVSADDAVTPILGYTFSGKYDNINQPPAFVEWMNNYKQQLKYIKTNKPTTLSRVKSAWSKNSVKSTFESETALTEVAPLLTTTWNQNCYYNASCPIDASGPCGHAYAGCVATAMGQIINYWKYPAACNDIPGYIDGLNYADNGNPISNSAYGWIAGISATTYNWSNMTNWLSSSSSDLQINAVAQLLYHCGVSVQMNYGLNGSGASSQSAAIALCKYFKYPASVQCKWKGDYSTTEWKDLLTNELDHNRPLYYSGNNIGSHAFVCDGYQNSDYFHFNWGWGGSSNGYYYIENLNPPGYNFNNNQNAIIGISTVSLPIIEYTNYNITDSVTSGLGNGNGIAEPGETISFPITFKNSGYAVANNVTAVLSCADTDISVITNNQSWSSIVVDASTIASNFKFSVSSGCPDKVVEFIIRINSNEGYWAKVLKVHVYKKSSVKVSVAGSLNSLFTTTQKSAVTFLSITGNIDARDFKVMRKNFPALSVIDLSGATILAYKGTGGTAGNSSISYPVNEIPKYAFYDNSTNTAMKMLTSIIIPASVTSIGDAAFIYCTGLTSITIPASVTYIGYYAFSDCSGLTSICIQSSVTSIGIGTMAFIGCTGLTSITIPASVTYIGDRAFQSCGLINVDTENPNYSSQDGVLYNKTKTLLMQCPTSKTDSFIIPSSVTSIGSEAFEYCTLLTSVIIPSSVISIGSYAFRICNSLTSITIPLSVTSIGERAFYSSSIYVDAGNPNYSSQNGVLYNKTKTLLIQCPTSKINSFIIQSSVTSIGNYAFYDCSGLTSINIPASVTSIGSSAFAYCSGLTSINAYPATPIDLTSSSSVFISVNKTTCTLYVPTGSKAAYQAAVLWKDFTNMAEFVVTAVPTINNENISVYPNPVIDGFRIKGIEGMADLRLIDLNGKLLLHKQVIGNENVSVSDFPAGMYMINLSSNGVSYQKKFIKK